MEELRMGFHFNADVMWVVGECGESGGGCYGERWDGGVCSLLGC